MADKEQQADEAFVPGYTSVDRKGVWVESNAVFPMEDPTNVGKGPLTRFEPKSFTQATKTDWLVGQWKAGTFEMYDGDPRDDDAKKLERPPEPIKVPAAAAAAAATAPAPTSAPAPAGDGGTGNKNETKK
jgi:hypothetical protein